MSIEIITEVEQALVVALKNTTEALTMATKERDEHRLNALDKTILLTGLHELYGKMKAERDALRLAAQAGLELLKMCQLYGPALAYGNTDIPTAITQLQAALEKA
jgi:hypothetical protein